jgi:hypothetical protein
VVGVSQQPSGLDIEALPAPVCEFCGTEIVEDDQRCVALDDGRCAA